MRYLAIIACLMIASCIKISTGELQLHQLDQALVRKMDARQSQAFWEAMQQLDFSYMSQLADSSDEFQFSLALQAMMRGDYETTPPVFEHLVDTSQDSLMVAYSGELLTGIYTLKANWDALIELDKKLPGGLDDMNTISMVKAWSQVQDEQIIFPENPFTVAMKQSLSGVPMIKVQVNGIEQTFWIDTGAEFTVLSSDIAEKCNVKPLIETASKVGTSTDKKISLWPGVIDELKIENLVIKNHPVFIIGKEDLEFRVLKIIRILKIDGIIGWNAIQNMKLEINYGQNLVTFQKSEQETKGERNMHFLTQPFVMVSDTNGVPFKFFLDTGANKTSLYDPSFAFFDTSSAEISNAMVGGAGGFQSVTLLILKDQSFVIGKTRIDFASIEGTSALGDDEEGFISYDGILGSDISKNAILTLDFQNGWCQLEACEN